MEKQSVYRSPMAGASVASFLWTVLFLWNFQGTVLLLKLIRKQREKEIWLVNSNALHAILWWIGIYGIDRTGENT